MPSDRHEFLVELLSSAPEGIREMLRGLGFRVSDAAQAFNYKESLNKVKTSSKAADAVWRFSRLDGSNEFGVVIEVQLDFDDDKPFTWPLYAAGLRADLRCDTCVLVVAPSARVARWASRPIGMGGGNEFRVIVLGPKQLRLITDEEEAKRSVALAVLGVLAHAKSDPETVGRAAVVATKACLSVSNKAFIWCYDAFYEALSGGAFAALEKLMELDVRNLKNEATRRQVAFGKADSILKVLKRRRLSITDEQEERILSCLDFDTLERWLESAFTASSTDELFTDE